MLIPYEVDDDDDDNDDNHNRQCNNQKMNCFF